MCFACRTRKRRDFDEIEAPSKIRRKKPSPPRTLQLAMASKGDAVHLVEVRPMSPEWTARTTVCGRKVDALLAYRAKISCDRCRAGA
jgi:hypothetical protein